MPGTPSADSRRALEIEYEAPELAPGQLQPPRRKGLQLMSRSAGPLLHPSSLSRPISALIFRKGPEFAVVVASTG